MTDNSGIETFQTGEVDANGQWHDILTGLTGCHVFEIIAFARGKDGEGKYAVMHATALGAMGKNKIRQTCAFYGKWFSGKWWNKVICRWKNAESHKYTLQIRTKSNYGPGCQINYRITKLWDESFMPSHDKP